MVRGGHCCLYDRRQYTAVVSAQQPTASTETPPEAKPEDKVNTGRISLNFGVDWASVYHFWGIAQEQSGANFQPYRRPR